MCIITTQLPYWTTLSYRFFPILRAVLICIFDMLLKVRVSTYVMYFSPQFPILFHKLGNPDEATKIIRVIQCTALKWMKSPSKYSIG